MSKNKKELQKLPTYGQLLKVCPEMLKLQPAFQIRLEKSKITMKAKNKVTAASGSLHCLALLFHQTFRKPLFLCQLTSNNPKQRVPFALGSDSLTTVDRHMLRLLS
ncbi:hypothetical protein T10_8079 [Trichinella papuae]|uniref:Uncharacterized protein n=1 Tax=Trichinella papuae TaxID=268474 RepID=A0A0V1MZG6_9BILA|nr:hypothetical protein T10_8079 [Trichinella papuae]